MDYKFTTDGCSGGMTAIWKILFNKVPPWNDCCIEHDKQYWKGGTAEERKLADLHLACGVAQNGYPLWASIMYVAVRVGGHPFLPLPWRWGYGWKYPKNYTKES